MNTQSLPETVLQLGAGRFLRSFVDRFIHHVNQTDNPVGKVVVVQSTAGNRAKLINQRQGSFHTMIRGFSDGDVVEKIEVVDSISRALVANDEWDQVLEVARSKDLQYLVTNSTEAGFTLANTDQLDAVPSTMPGKLTKILHERFQAKGAPLTLLPCELIEGNADQLLELVLEQSKNWNLSEEFQTWVSNECYWVNNLVDCIVTDGPKEEDVSDELTETDPLLTQAEPYTLWALQQRPGRPLNIFSHPTIQIVDDLSPFYLRKVRILNGLHTAMVEHFLPQGFKTVQHVMQGKESLKWVRALLYQEIIPTITTRIPDLAEYADEVLDRFRNPFMQHRLSDIKLNHAAKLKVRLQPTHDEYQKLYGQAPPILSSLLANK